MQSPDAGSTVQILLHGDGTSDSNGMTAMTLSPALSQGRGSPFDYMFRR
jgi:hypothetical protein